MRNKVGRHPSKVLGGLVWPRRRSQTNVRLAYSKLRLQVGPRWGSRMCARVVHEGFRRFPNERVSGYTFTYTDCVVVFVIATNREYGR
jgi:hypothetical protein